MIKNESRLYKTRAVHLFLFVLVQVEDALEVNTFIWIREQNADRYPKFRECRSSAIVDCLRRALVERTARQNARLPKLPCY